MVEGYLTDAEVEKAAIRQKESNRTVDPYDSCTRAVHELCAKMNSRYRMCDMATSFDRGHYHQRQFNKWMWKEFVRQPVLLSHAWLFV